MLLLAGCSGNAATTTTTSIQDDAPPTVTTPPAATSTLLPTIEACPEVPYRPLVVPDRVAGEDTEAADLGDDPYSTIPGTSIKLWVGEASSPVVALIRGSLPPESWVGPTARIDVLRQDAALGPLPGDRWAVAWFESEDRCDLYTLLLYPPTSAAEVLEVAESLIPDR
jgi:hypothetical protein